MFCNYFIHYGSEAINMSRLYSYGEVGAPLKFHLQINFSDHLYIMIKLDFDLEIRWKDDLFVLLCFGEKFSGPEERGPRRLMGTTRIQLRDNLSQGKKKSYFNAFYSTLPWVSYESPERFITTPFLSQTSPILRYAHPWLSYAHTDLATPH